MARTVAALALVASTSALVAPVSKVSKVVEKYTDSTLKSSPGGFMEQGTEMFQEQFPEFNSYGWGVSVKAERWNGRHAMFGWAFIIATGYCKAHGLIPDPEKLLDFKQWGTLAIISGGKSASKSWGQYALCLLRKGERQEALQKALKVRASRASYTPNITLAQVKERFGCP